MSHMTFCLFQSRNKSPKECAEWCDVIDNCAGFATVDRNVRPGANSCYLKKKLNYPNKAQDGTRIYYKLHDGKDEYKRFRQREFIIDCCTKRAGVKCRLTPPPPMTIGPLTLYCHVR